MNDLIGQTGGDQGVPDVVPLTNAEIVHSRPSQNNVATPKKNTGLVTRSTMALTRGDQRSYMISTLTWALAYSA